MDSGGVEALTVGKEYPIKEIGSRSIVIINDQFEDHYFDLHGLRNEEWATFFTVKSNHVEEQPKESVNNALQWLHSNDDFDYQDINGVDVPTHFSIAKVMAKYANQFATPTR